MKFCIVICLPLLIGLKANAQISLETLIKVYNKNNLSEAKKALRTIPGFQLTDSLMADTVLGGIKEGNIKAYINHNRTYLECSFGSEDLYKALYKQSEKKFKYTNDYVRGSRDGTSRYTTSFSNYERAKIGSLKILLVVVSSRETDRVICYELLLLPYYED